MSPLIDIPPGSELLHSRHQNPEKAKPAAATKLIPELAAMKFPAKMVAKLEALAEAGQDTVLNYVNSGMKINDALRLSPAAMRICSWTRSMPVTSSVTGCSTWMRAFTSMK